ncbi:MAG: hypothetical protein ACE37F_12360 [Nannocystaceae bacterium]|nr:hypothetical protein [bacterium]
MFLATKIEAFNDRGDGDLQASHDAEDVFVVVDGRPSIVSDVAAASPEARSFIAEELGKWIAAADFPNALEGALEPGRDAIAEPRLRRIAELG